MTNIIRNLVSKEKHRYQADGFDLDLSYVTPRLIAMGYPSDKLEGMYRNKMSEVKRFFLQKHLGHYKVYNLCSERSYSPKHFMNATASFPFDDHNPCEFHMLIQFCEDAKTYLDQDPKNIIAVHCKAGKGRTGLVLCCYLQFSKESATPQEALAFYAEARTKDKLGVTIPSQIRWVEHFGTYLHRYRWPNRPIALRGVPIQIVRLEIHGYPGYFDPNFLLPHLKILKMDKSLVWDSKVNALPLKWHKVSPLCPIKCETTVSGDFHLICYHNDKKLFGLWEHTSFLCQEEDKALNVGDEYYVTYKKSELDGPAKDCKRHEKFPKDFRVVLVCKPISIVPDGSPEAAEADEDDSKKRDKAPLMGTMHNPIKKLVSKKKLRFQQDGFDLDLSYITPTVIAMGFPSINLEGMYRNKMSDVVKFLRFYHEGHYKVYNLCSERTYTADHFQNNCASYPFDDHNPCPFKTLVKFCEDAAEFGKRDSKNCRVVHCKAGKGRTGLVIAALLLLEESCSSAGKALEYYGGKRTSNVKGVTIPSQRRYVHYYEDYLANYLKVARPFSFTAPIITLIGMHLNPCIDFSGGGCTPYFKVSKMDKTVIYNHKSDKRGKLSKWKKGQPGWACQCNVQLQGDIHITFYDNNSKMFGFWLHTAFIKTQSIVLEKDELDGASNDKKHQIFAENFNCQVFFTGVEDEHKDDATPGFRSHTNVASPQDFSKFTAACAQETKENASKDDAEEEEETSSEEEGGAEISDDEYLEGHDHPDDESDEEKLEVVQEGPDGIPPPPPSEGRGRPRDASPNKSPAEKRSGKTSVKGLKGASRKSEVNLLVKKEEAQKVSPSPELKPTAQPRRSGIGLMLDTDSGRPKLATKPGPDKPAPARPSIIGSLFPIDRSVPPAPPSPSLLAQQSASSPSPLTSPPPPPSPSQPPKDGSPIVGPPLDEKLPDSVEARRISLLTGGAPTKKAPTAPPNKKAPATAKPANVVIHRPSRRASLLAIEEREQSDEPPPPPPPPPPASEVVSLADEIKIEVDKVAAELQALTLTIAALSDPKMQSLLEASRGRLIGLQADLQKRHAEAIESDELVRKFENMILQIGARLSDDRPDWLKILESCGFTAAERGIIAERMKQLRAQQQQFTS